MRQLNLRTFFLLGATASIFTFAGCVPPNANNGNAPVNSNANSSNTNATTSNATSDVSIDAREPDVYRAKLNFSAETMGDQTDQSKKLPTFTVDYTRNQADRRISFNVPGAGSIVYLDVKDKRYVIMPDRKQYAELTPEATGGMQIPSSLTPGEIVDRLKNAKGYQLVGDDTLNGRAVTKYRFAGSKPTETAAGTVSAESYLYVDKATGLPLRTETVTQGSNEVKGVKAIKLVTEMTDVQTNVDPTAFDLPAGLTKISTEEIKQNVEATVRLALAVLAQMQQQNSAPSGSPSPAATPSPAK